MQNAEVCIGVLSLRNATRKKKVAMYLKFAGRTNCESTCNHCELQGNTKDMKNPPY